MGRLTGGVALGPSPRGVTGVPSGRRGGGTAGRPVGFCSCMSSPGATGLRMPGGIAGRLEPGAPLRGPVPARPPSPRLPLPSRRIGLPTNSRGLPERPAPGRPEGEPGRVGAPGRCTPVGRCGDPVRCPPAAPGRGVPGLEGAPVPGLFGWGRPTSSGLAGLCGEGTVRFTGDLGWGRPGGGGVGRAPPSFGARRIGAVLRGLAAVAGDGALGLAGGGAGRLALRAGAGEAVGRGAGCCGGWDWRSTGF